MPYEPTNWKSGDVVTSAKLNKLEKGVQDATGLVVHAIPEDDVITLDHTWQEIYDAAESGVVFYAMDDDSGARIGGIVYTVTQMYATQKYVVMVVSGLDTLTFEANATDDYPVVAEG